MARKSSTEPDASAKKQKRGLSVPLLGPAEAKVRRLAKVTRLPLRDVLARLGSKVTVAIGDLATELGAESAQRHEAELKEIVGGEGGVQPVFALEQRRVTLSETPTE